jgi:hypothetical protein
VGGKGGEGVGQGGEMNQALYAHMTNKRKMKKKFPFGRLPPQMKEFEKHNQSKSLLYLCICFLGVLEFSVPSSNWILFLFLLITTFIGNKKRQADM